MGLRNLVLPYMLKRSIDDDGEQEASIEDQVTSIDRLITCTLGKCEFDPQLFDLYPRYEAHVFTNHNYTCHQCLNKFPSQLFLELHIDENHNPFLKIEQEKGGKIFKCFQFANGCKKVCSNPKKRRLHMIDKHNYPQDYKWNVINNGI